jgi:D-alanyl-D-alanine-carboxypeptidase/D-alanyl-D-alanine-endopeptidase
MKISVFRALICYVYGVLVPVFASCQVGTFPKLDALASGYVGHANTRGLSVGVLYNGSVHFAGYGRLSAKDPSAPDEATIYEIGALSGVFTAALLAIQESGGLLEPVTPVSAVMPEGYTIPAFAPTRLVETYPDSSADNSVPSRTVVCMPDPVAGTTEITLCQLAYHSSGLVFPGKPVVDWHPLASPSSPKLEGKDLPDVKALLGQAGNSTFRFPPGEKFEFSVTGIALLGSLLATQAQVSYEVLLKNRLTGPLGMADTRIQSTPAQLSRLAPGHDTRGRPVPNWYFQAMAPAVGLKSNTRDLIQLLRGLSDRLPPFTENTVQRIQQGVVPVHFPGWQRPTSSALGWLVSTAEDNRTIVWMSGATEGYRAFIGFDPQRKRGVVLLANAAQDLTTLGFEMLRIL